MPPTLIESLEPRRLFTISLGASHILNVRGSPGAPNTITVGLAPGGLSVYADVSWPTKKKVINQTATFPLSRGILQVTINGGNLADIITIDQTNGSFPIKTAILSHNGNDTINGGDEPDKIVLGNGNDVVNSGNGKDNLYAGLGHDTITGGSGNDVFHGSVRGHDKMIAGDGSNIFVDPHGTDTVMGGSGHNTFVLKNIQLDPENNYDPTKDTIKQYVPPSAPQESLGQSIIDDIFNYGLF
jgi:Ca2+-binding RTX toxin-like protein